MATERAGTGPAIPESAIEVGRVIWRRRRELEMGQEELGVAVGTSQARISRIEKGIANPTLLTLERLEEVLGIDLIVRPGSSSREPAGSIKLEKG